MHSSTGLSTRTAAALAYGGWWITGAIVWYLERRDPVARFHAAQSMLAFGAIAMLTLGLALLSAVALTFFPGLFDVLIAATAGVFLGGVALWVVSLWRAASGREWRIPLAATYADRLATVSAPAKA